MFLVAVAITTIFYCIGTVISFENYCFHSRLKQLSAGSNHCIQPNSNSELNFVSVKTVNSDSNAQLGRLQ